MGQHCCRRVAIHDSNSPSMGSAHCQKQPYNQTEKYFEGSFAARTPYSLKVGKGFQVSCETDECPITLQSLTQLASQNDLVITWCCHTCMSRSALVLWLKRSSDHPCPHCRSNAIVPQIFGQRVSVLDGAHSVHILIQEGRPAKFIEDLLANVPASLYAVDRLGRTALHYAIVANRADIVKLLCDYGVDVDSADDDGNAPLFLAVQFKSPSIAKLLLSRKASGQLKRAYDLILYSCGSKESDGAEWTDYLKQCTPGTK